MEQTSRKFLVIAAPATSKKLEEAKETLTERTGKRATQNNIVNWAIQNMNIDRFCKHVLKNTPKHITFLRHDLTK